MFEYLVADTLTSVKKLIRVNSESGVTIMKECVKAFGGPADLIRLEMYVKKFADYVDVDADTLVPDGSKLRIVYRHEQYPVADKLLGMVQEASSPVPLSEASTTAVSELSSV